MEKKYYSTSELCKMFNVTPQCLLIWRKNGKLPYKKLSSKTIVYDKKLIDEMFNNERSINEDKKLNIGYARVSTQKQKNNLIKQSQVLRDYANASGVILDEIYTEVASGMNENREELNKIVKLVLDKKVDKIFITYKDRLTRFGFDYFKNIFELNGTEIVVLNNPIDEEDEEKEITQDLISIIHHFSMKMYSNRRKQLNEFKKNLEKENKE